MTAVACPLACGCAPGGTVGISSVQLQNTDLSGAKERVQEMKMTNETRKIWSNDSVMAAATCIRVPVMRAHAEAINLELQDDIEEDEAREIIGNAPGVSLLDDR